MSVAALILEADGSVENACAGLLRDVLEDAGPEYAEEIRTRLYEDVLRLVDGCTDGVPDAAGEKEPWAIRKKRYIAHLKTVPDNVLMMSACDKLHNLRSILRDLNNGEAVFERFSVPKDKTLWCCDTLMTIFEAREPPYAQEMREILQALGIDGQRKELRLRPCPEPQTSPLTVSATGGQFFCPIVCGSPPRRPFSPRIHHGCS